MKYIRTKDGIFKVKERRIIFPVIPAGEPITIFNTNTLEKDVIKQADTIEELCDKVVLNKIDIIILNKEHTQYRFESSDEWFDITETELKKGIYGANWVNKGLRFVARMNKEGNWNLL